MTTTCCWWIGAQSPLYHGNESPLILHKRSRWWSCMFSFFLLPFCTLLSYTSLGNRQYVHTKVFIGFFPLFFLYVNFVLIICCCKGIGIPCRMCRVLDAIWPVSSSFSMKWKSVCKECMWLALVWALKWLASLVHHWKNWIFDCQESQVGTKIALNYFPQIIPQHILLW